MWPHTFLPLGDRALTVDFSDVPPASLRDLLRCLDAALQDSLPPGVTALLPAIRSLTLHYDPLRTSPAALRERVTNTLQALEVTTAAPRPTVIIPVCYGGEYGPDLDFVAQAHETTAAAIIAAHARPEYLVAMIGFLPGFPYLEGLEATLHTPRRDVPRTAVPAGSVGIGGGSTGVYPFVSPGGWHLIGRTPRSLFNATRTSPALLAAGDRVRFVAIDPRDWRLHAD